MPKQGGGWLYLATWLDRYSRKVVGWDVRESMPEDLVSEALRRALAMRQPAAGLVVHSDQGSQYSAINFKALVARHEAVQSMSRRGNCYDNAHAESFWGRLKAELLAGGSFRNLSEARLEISHYLAYYSAKRRHSARGYLAPNHFETHFQTTSQLCAAQLDHLKHPLVAVIDLSQAQPMPAPSFQFGLYAVGLKELNHGHLRYGRKHYDYQEGSLIFIAPGQVVGVQPGVELFAPKGWALLFHPDMLLDTPLGKRMPAYSFFSYEVHEALHLSEKEKTMVIDCFAKIEYELEQTIDKHSKGLIAANIELLLQYCLRFYDRQFITRDNANRGILERFEHLLRDYFSTDKPQNEGLPSVAYCAEALHLSPNYFGDLVKKETGNSAQEYIQTKVIEVAKERLFDRHKQASEIAYELGFRYPQHFTRLFKQKTGATPNDYRMRK